MMQRGKAAQKVLLTGLDLTEMPSEFTTKIAVAIVAAMWESSPDDKACSSPPAVAIAFRIGLKQSAAQTFLHMLSMDGTNGNSFLPLSMALLSDKNICYPGDHPVAFNRMYVLPALIQTLPSLCQMLPRHFTATAMICFLQVLIVFWS